MVKNTMTIITIIAIIITLTIAIVTSFSGDSGKINASKSVGSSVVVYADGNSPSETVEKTYVLSENAQFFDIDISRVGVDSFKFSVEGENPKSITLRMGAQLSNGNIIYLSEYLDNNPDSNISFPSQNYSNGKKYDIVIDPAPNLANVEYIFLEYYNHSGFNLGALNSRENGFLAEYFDFSFSDAVANNLTVDVNLSNKRVQIGQLENAVVESVLRIDPLVLYNPNDFGSSAWREGLVGVSPPGSWSQVDFTSYSGSELNTISVNDSNAVSLVSGSAPEDDYDAAHRFKIKVDELTEFIDRLDFAIGYNASSNAGTVNTKFYIGNATDTSWKLIYSDTTEGVRNDINFSINSGFTDYIEESGLNNYVYLLVYFDFPSNIDSQGDIYYVELQTFVDYITPITNVTFVSPTPDNLSTQSDGSFLVNATINATTLTELNYTFDGTLFPIIDKDLVALYNLDQFTHKTDSSEYGNDLSCNTCPSLNANGRYKEGYKFDGVDDDLSVSTPKLNTPEFTVALWFNSTSVGGVNRALISQRRGADYYQYQMITNSDGILRSYTENNGDINSVKLTGDGVISTNRWYHAAYSYNGSHYMLYQDGVLVNSTESAITAPDDPDLNMSIASNLGAAPYEGLIDEVFLYNRSLSDKEIEQLYLSHTWKENYVEYGFLINQTENLTDGLADGTYTYRLSAYNGTGGDFEERNITISAADTCTYTSGDWVINVSDNCVITETINIRPNDLIIVGDNGNFKVDTGYTVRARNFILRPDSYSGTYHVSKQNVLSGG